MSKLHLFLITLVLALACLFTASVTTAAKTPSFRAQVHVEDYGWMKWVDQGGILGTTGQGRRMEAIRIELVDAPKGMGISYRVFVGGKGWLPWAADGQPLGTTGAGTRIEAIEIKLTNNATGLHLRYQGHVESVGWMGWVEEGETAGMTDRGLRLEALRLELTEATTKAGSGVEGLSVRYESHSARLGWTGWFSNGETSGTTGQALQLEAIKIEIVDPKDRVGVRYQGRIRGEGWTDWFENGAELGSTGQHRSLDAIKIELINPTQWGYRAGSGARRGLGLDGLGARGRGRGHDSPGPPPRGHPYRAGSEVAPLYLGRIRLSGSGSLKSGSIRQASPKPGMALQVC